MGVLDNIVRSGKKIYDEGNKRQAADAPAFIETLGKGNSMPGSARKAAAPAVKPEAVATPKRRADPNDVGRVMRSLGMGAGEAAKTLNQRKKTMP